MEIFESFRIDPPNVFYQIMYEYIKYLVYKMIQVKGDLKIYPLFDYITIFNIAFIYFSFGAIIFGFRMFINFQKN